MSMDVTLARNAEEAIALCKSESFDIIFLDYILPEMNGDSIIPVIKQYLPGSKIVMISGWTSSPLKKKKIERSVNAWIDKPFDLARIISCISELSADGTTSDGKGGLH
jgi:YesN/AraC family two-component response regulator